MLPSKEFIEEKNRIIPEIGESCHLLAKSDDAYLISKMDIPDNFSLNLSHFPTRIYLRYRSIKFENCTFTTFPRAENLDRIKNLTYLACYNCNLTEITPESLRGFEKLKELWIDANNIETLPRGLFEHTPNLEVVSFNRNKIKEIDADILEPLKMLKYFSLTANVSISVKYDAIRGEGNLSDIKEKIKMCDPIEILKAEMRKELEAINDFSVMVNGKAFQVNKTLLITNSPLLARMINESPDADRLEIKDISEETFEEDLKYMRNKNPPNETVNLVELFAAGARLEMKKLKDQTASILMDKVTPESAVDVIKLCQKYRHDELLKKAFIELKKTIPDEY